MCTNTLLPLTLLILVMFSCQSRQYDQNTDTATNMVFTSHGTHLPSADILTDQGYIEMDDAIPFNMQWEVIASMIELNSTRTEPAFLLYAEKAKSHSVDMARTAAIEKCKLGMMKEAIQYFESTTPQGVSFITRGSSLETLALSKPVLLAQKPIDGGEVEVLVIMGCEIEKVKKNIASRE
ncbi:hypothetical protein V6R21_25745 [Limibacter armeniacum]|uniref:hypothetical protein n=1 Tax=Limibacter armeniacum TaxID=466084 RepID=UPI002FE62EE9